MNNVQDVLDKLKQRAKELDIKILWVSEPGEAARKRREEEERRDSIS